MVAKKCMAAIARQVLDARLHTVKDCWSDFAGDGKALDVGSCACGTHELWDSLIKYVGGGAHRFTLPVASN